MINGHSAINTTVFNTSESYTSNSQLHTKVPIAFNRSSEQRHIAEPYLSKMDDEFCDDLNHLNDAGFCSKYLNIEQPRAERLFDRVIQALKEHISPSPREKRPLSDPPDKTPPLGAASDQPSSAKHKESTPCQHKVVGNKAAMVLADYHTNKQIQSVYRAVGCKQPHTITQSHIVNNGYELNPDNSALCNNPSGRLGFGAQSSPMVGASPIDNLHYYEWQLLTARIAGLDGFLVEWGFPPRQSSPDKAIMNMKTVLAEKKRGGDFALVPLWIPHWTVKPGKHLSLEQRENQFRARLEDMIQRYYQDDHCIHNRGNPLLFMLNFWGGGKSDLTLNRQELEQFFRKNPDLAKVRLVYRMAGRTAWQATSVKQVVSDFPWLVPRNRAAKDSTNPFIANNFARYGTREDIRSHANLLDNLHHQNSDHLPIKTMPVYPGIDTRGAPWSACDSFLPETENGRNTYEFSWEEARKKKPSLVIVETFNDFSEGTHIEPTRSDLGQRVATTAKQICLLKGQRHDQCNAVANQAQEMIRHAARLYDTRMMMDKLKYVFSENTLAEATKSLDRWANSLFSKKVDKIDQHAAMFDLDFQRLPFDTLVTVMNTEKKNLPESHRLNGQLLFAMSSVPIENITHTFIEADLKLRIKTENGMPSKISLSTKINTWEYEELAEIYTPYNQLESIVTIPMTAQTDKQSYGDLTEQYVINHPPSGCTVELLEIRIKTYRRKTDSDSLLAGGTQR